MRKDNGKEALVHRVAGHKVSAPWPACRPLQVRSRYSARATWSAIQAIAQPSKHSSVMAMLLRKAAAGLRPALQPAAVVPRAPTSIHLQPSLPIFHTGRNVIAKTADYGQPTSRKIKADYTVCPTSVRFLCLSTWKAL